MTWVPPHGSTPTPPTPPPAQPAPAAPEATPVSTAPVTAKDTFTRTAILVGVIGGVVLGSLIGGVGTGLSLATAPPAPSYDPYDPDPYDPSEPTGDHSTLTEGDPGEPQAETPLVCTGACFDETSAEAAILEDKVFDQFGGLGIFKHVWKMTGDRTTADAAHLDAWDTWRGAGYSPDECFATWSSFPVVEPQDAAVTPDFVAPLTEHTSDASYLTVLTQSVRLFSDTASAATYMQRLDADLDQCVHYVVPGTGVTDTITREPTLHPGPSVAAVGFVDSRNGTRNYVFDLQRGNMVIRSVAVSDGGIDDTRFRVLMLKQAALLEELTPAG